MRLCLHLQYLASKMRSKKHPWGVEQAADFPGNSDGREQRGAECGTTGAPNLPIDPGPASVVEAWPTLPDAIKAGILAMVGTAKGARQ